MFLIPLIYLVYLYVEKLDGNSWSIIKEHFFNNFSYLMDRDLLKILFGTGYQRSEKLNIVDYNELFIVNYIYYFGLFGLIFLSLIFLYFIISMKKNYYRYDRLALAMIVTVPINLFHYNLFFHPFVLFIYFYIASYVYNKNKLSIN